MICYYYVLATGVFTGQNCSCPDELDQEQKDWFMTNNCPADCGMRTDVADWMSQKVDIESEDEPQPLIDYQPPSPEPSGHYDWNATTKRWELNATGQGAITDSAALATAQAQIDAIALSKQRQVWQFMLGGATDPTLAAELQTAYDEMETIAVAAGLWPEE